MSSTTSDRIEVLMWNPDDEEYQLEFTYYPDGTVDGDGSFANRVRYFVRILEDRGEAPKDWFAEVAARMLTNWDNGVYKINVYSDG